MNDWWHHTLHLANRPRLIYQYSNMASRLSGQNCKFFKFLLSPNSHKRLWYKESNTKYRSLTLKRRSHVRILIYRTWPICSADHWNWESTKHGPLVHGLPPWTGSMHWVHQNMDRVHGPPIFTSWGHTIYYNLMTFYDTMRNYSSFGKPYTSLTAHLPLQFMLNSSFSLSLVIFKHTGWFWKV